MTYGEFIKEFTDVLTEWSQAAATFNIQERRGRTKDGKRRTTSGRVKAINGIVAVFGMHHDLPFEILPHGREIHDWGLDNQDKVFFRSDRYRETSSIGIRNKTDVIAIKREVHNRLKAD